VTTTLDVTLACGTVMDLEGSVRPVMYLTSELVYRLKVSVGICANNEEDNIGRLLENLIN